MTKYDLMNAEKTDELGHSIIYLVSRDINRQRKFHKIVGFQPHGWVVDPNGSELDLFGNHISLVVKPLSSDIGKMAKEIGKENTRECDILFPLRYLIDQGIRCSYEESDGVVTPCESQDIPPKKGFFDLEVETPPEILARPKNAKWPIVSFQFSNNYDDQLTLFMLNTEVVGKEIPIPAEFLGCKSALEYEKLFKHKWGEETVHATIYRYTDEKMMIYDVARWIARSEFDLLTGWNSNLFDLPYLMKRAEYLHVNIQPISPFGEVHLSTGPDHRAGEKDRMTFTKEGRHVLNPRIKGMQLVDLMEMYKKWSGGRQPIVKGRPFGLTYDFHMVMEYECGFFYIDLGDAVMASRMQHPLDWVEYCMGDAFGLKLLDDRKGIIKYFDRLRRIVGVPLEWTVHNSRLIDMRLLRLRDHPLPTRVIGEKERVKGAIVFLPDIGIHENVAYIDEKALYPTLIRLYNLSPETLVLDKAKWQRDDIVVGPMEDGTILHFRSKPKGIFPKAVEYDMEEREFYRKQLRTMLEKNPKYEETKMLETLHKFLSCSYYGVTGYEGFRLMNKWVRKAITFLGREGLLKSSADAERQGYHRLYGDTDGLFFKLHTDVPGEGRIVEAIVNKTLQRIAMTRGASFWVEAKYEHYCKRIIFVPKLERRHGEIIAAKKNYAYIDEKDNLFVTGLAPRRSSTAAMTRELMLPWLEFILIKKDVKSAVELIQKAWNELPNYPANKIGLPRGVQKEHYGRWVAVKTGVATTDKGYFEGPTGKEKKVFHETKNPWREGMAYMRERYGKVFREDKKPLLIWMKGTNVQNNTNKLTSQVRGCDTRVICITEKDTEIPTELKPYVNWKRMRRLILTNRFKPLFEAIGLKWEDVMQGTKQSGLGQWQ